MVPAAACLGVWSVVLPPGRAEAGPVVGSGPRRPWRCTVEYDIDFPVTAAYTLQICYAAAEARPTEKYSRSYVNLIGRGLVSYMDCRYGRSGFRAMPPLTHFSHRSKLAVMLLKGHGKVKLPQAEFLRIVTWIDANVPYYGTYRGKKSLEHKDAPDFRPPPLTGKCPISIECRVIGVQEIGDHDLFLGEAVAEHVAEVALDEDGQIVVGKLDPLCYLHSEYWSCGTRLGRHGFSRK